MKCGSENCAWKFFVNARSMRMAMPNLPPWRAEGDGDEGEREWLTTVRSILNDLRAQTSEVASAIVEFDEQGRLGWKSAGEAMGFRYVASGPMVRSSYKAGEFFMQAMIDHDKQEQEQREGQRDDEDEGASRAPKAQTATAKCSATATGMEWMSSAASFAL